LIKRFKLKLHLFDFYNKSHSKSKAYLWQIQQQIEQVEFKLYCMFAFHVGYALYFKSSIVDCFCWNSRYYVICEQWTSAL